MRFRVPYGASGRRIRSLRTTSLESCPPGKDGSFAGVQRLTRNFTLSQDGDHFTGTIGIEIFDVNDNLIGTGCATEITKRVE